MIFYGVEIDIGLLKKHISNLWLNGFKGNQISGREVELCEWIGIDFADVRTVHEPLSQLEADGLIRWSINCIDETNTVRIVLIN